MWAGQGIGQGERREEQGKCTARAHGDVCVWGGVGHTQAKKKKKKKKACATGGLGQGWG